MRTNVLGMATVLAAALTMTACGSDGDRDDHDDGPVTERTPNILFVIMDDVGADQLRAMGYGGVEGPATPSIDALAANGVRFRNTWSMPECSPGRSALMTGRYPLRNNIYQAIGPNDLANSQVDPWEMTVAKVLATAGYQSGMFGKFHLAGPEHNEAGNGTPAQLGWHYFYGWTGGLPGSIDTSAGGVAPHGTYSCGFVPDASQPNGADAGACYLPGGGCVALAGKNDAGDAPGLQCLSRGGVLVPNAACQAEPPAGLVFERENAHYVSPLVVNRDGKLEEAALTDPRGRGFRTTIEVDAAIAWIKDRRAASTPWMATLSFSSPHTPLQPPPGHLLRSGIGARLTAACDDPINQRRLADAMIEALDTELARLLVETGIARQADDGRLIYDPATSDTMVVVVGDNGSFGPTVKLPFDPQRAKGSAYQTGVWVPLIVSGPLVEQPDRSVEHMVNATDVFRLFADIAVVDLAATVTRRIDAEELLPYLRDPAQPAIRQFNFTQGGLNLQANNGVNPPCVFNGNLCSHTPISKGVCEDNGGVWWGPGADDPSVLEGDLRHCWEVNQAIYRHDSVNYERNRITMGATVYQAVRDEHYKLVRNRALDYDPAIDGPVEVVTEEFYRIDQAVPVPRLDRAEDDLLARVLPLTSHERARLEALRAELDAILASQHACPGDGNGDGVVDETDLAEYARIAAEWGLSSLYDFNLDGLTNAQDLAVIQANMGPCPR